MKTIKNWDKIPEGGTRKERDHKRWSKRNKERIDDDYQQSMREDMRGPMEGMEAVPEKM